MTTAVLLDHVSAYAAAVRAHLSDLSPEQVEDLTDGLEADLAEALEDPRGAVATGQVPWGGDRPEGTGRSVEGGESMIDLTRRFGPAERYAAELRTAAGLAVAPGSVREPVRSGLREARRRLGSRLRATAAPVTSSRHWPDVVAFLVSLRPAWWVLRGWVWFVVAQWVLRSVDGTYGASPWVARSAVATAVLVGFVVLSVQWGRGVLAVPRWAQALLRWAALAAAVLAAPLVLAAGGDLAATNGGPAVATQSHQEDGVFVGGERATNLFVYDASGEPLSGVQIFDEAGRPVETADGPWTEWQPSGGAEPWSLFAATDTYGQERWNVYPLTGAPVSDVEWTWDDAAGRDRQGLLPGREAAITPPPFETAPPVTQPGVEESEAVEPEGAEPPVEDPARDEERAETSQPGGPSVDLGADALAGGAAVGEP